MIISKTNNKKITTNVSESYLDEKIFGNTDDTTNILLSSDKIDDEVDEAVNTGNYSGLDFDVDDSVFEVVKTSNESEEAQKELPKTDADFGISNMLNALIRDEWEAIEGYNSTIVTLNDIGFKNAEQIKGILSDIVKEENIHVGQLQKALELVSPNAVAIETGAREATEQIEDNVVTTKATGADVLHPGMTVQTFDTKPVENQRYDDVPGVAVCTLSDIDDSF